jgi:opacity protein-like surface antigen
MINRRIVICLFAYLAISRSMLAAADEGATVGALVAATSIGTKTEASVAGTVGYRMNRFLGFGLELTAMPTVKPDAATFAGPTVSGTDGRAIVFTTNVRVERPMSARLVPYLVGGGGVANVKEIFAVTPSGPPGIPVVVAPQSVTRSSTDLTLTAGGGVSLMMTGHASIDVDLRYLRFIGDRDQNVGRYGVGFSFRF